MITMSLKYDPSDELDAAVTAVSHQHFEFVTLILNMVISRLFLLEFM